MDRTRGFEEAMDVFRKLWIILKLLYSDIVFWTSPTPEEEFYTEKGNYYSELGRHDRAKKSYEKAQRTAANGITGLIIGNHYAQIGNHDEAVKAYREAVKKPGGRQGKVGLAIEEYESGNLENSEAVIRELRASGRLGTSEQTAIDILEAQIEVTKRARADRGSGRD